MLMRSDRQIDKSLHDLLSPNRIDIGHDITLLENQLPWKVRGRDDHGVQARALWALHQEV
jgi:hypothetical protein